MYIKQVESMGNMNNNLDNHQKKAFRYMPGLDGLRAIAVIGIIIYHLNKQWLTGGFLGVDTFFVISGYLITSLLLKEYEETGTINLKQFWIRRIKRLVPAVLFLLLSVIALTLIFEPSYIVKIKHDAIAAFFYLSNWWYIAKDINYFEQFSFMPLKHLWSLAIEEQFYIFFPLVLFLLFKWIKNKRNIGLIFWVVSLVSLFLMVLISEPNMEQSRVYFGTDTRLQTILLGVLLAFIWPPHRLKAHPPKALTAVIDMTGIVGIAILGYFMYTVGDSDDWIYNGGFYLISLMTLLIIASAAHPTGWVARGLGNPVFVFIGKRSYSLYLWHFIVISFVHRHYVDGQIPMYVYAIDILLTLALAEISYRYVENPIRKQGWRAFSLHYKRGVAVLRTLIAMALLAVTVSVFAGVFDHMAKDETANKATSFNTEQIDKYIIDVIPIQNVGSNKHVIQDDDNNKVYRDIKPLLIGDSVMVDIGEYFKEKVPNARIDGQVGRNLYDAIPLAKQNYSNYDKASDKIVLELGTNGDFSEEQLDELIDIFGKADIYLVNTRVPRNYEAHVNKLMAAAAKKHKNVTLVDWYKRSEGHTEYFAPDGIHLEYSGVKALSNEILKEMVPKDETS